MNQKNIEKILNHYFPNSSPDAEHGNKQIAWEISQLDKTGINVKRFETYILDNFGEKCPDYCFDCITCKMWRLYEELESVFEFLDYPEIEEKEWKNIRPHK